MRRFFLPVLLLLALLEGSPAAADPAPFDLVGPVLRVSVTHQGKTLPIAEVPQLAAGDGITVRADLPADQAARYLLIAAFLRGSTNPPPDKWFYQAETWTKKGREGLSLTVPDGAQQIVLFMAPATGGDFPTLRNAVRGRPGAFVRAAQDLAQASLDHGRLSTYLRAIRIAVPSDPGRLERITPLLARSLTVKINPDCLAKMPELQAACLLQNQESLVLNDGHSNAITESLAGPGVDLALQISATPQGGLGYYSPYIAAVRDIIGIFSSIHTAKYQYIPALVTLDEDRMGLVLNTPPSFHNPKSVIVTALPIVAPVHVPPMQIVEPTPPLCASLPQQVLPVSGAPLVYSTHYAHDLSLRVALPDGRQVDLPATPDAEQGGLIIRAGDGIPANLTTPLDATLHGIWGFQPFEGPKVHLQIAQPGKWQVIKDAATAKVGTIIVNGGAAGCVTGVTIASGDTSHPAGWKVTRDDEIAITPPAGISPSSAMTIEVSGPDGTPPDKLTLAGKPQPKRFSATPIARNVQRPSTTTPIAITLASDIDIPTDATLTVSLRADKGVRFSGRETVEVAAAFGGNVTLTTSNGLTLADPQVAILKLEPMKMLGSSAFGELRFRIAQDGIAGDWQTLGMLVRLPDLHQLQCPTDASETCELSGDRLFLIDGFSATSDFAHPTDMPEGYPGNAIQVPHPVGGALYLRLRDDPGPVNRIAG